MTRCRQLRVTAAILRGAGRILPASRAEWGLAMQSEAAEIEDGREALEFALGCMFASVAERIVDMDTAVKWLRAGTIAGMSGGALLTARTASAVTAVNPPTGMVFVVSSAVFAAAALWTLLRGPSALVQAATMMLLVYGLAIGFLHLTGDSRAWLNLQLYQALALEGLIIWSVLLAAGLFLSRAARGPADGLQAASRAPR